MRPRHLFWLAVGVALVVTGGVSAQVGPVIQTTFSTISSARLSGSGAAPTCSSTGLGTGSAAIAAGSTDLAGVCVLSPTGAPAATGTMTLTFTASYGANGGPVCSALLVSGSSNWRPSAISVQQTLLSLTAPTFLWENNATALTAGQTYNVAYVCIGR